MIRQVILEQGMQQGQSGLLSRLIVKKFHLPSDNVADSLHDLCPRCALGVPSAR